MVDPKKPETKTTPTTHKPETKTVSSDPRTTPKGATNDPSQDPRSAAATRPIALAGGNDRPPEDPRPTDLPHQKRDPNLAPEQGREATAEEKKQQAEYEKLEKEAIDKTAKVNQRLAKEGSPNRMSYEVRNGETVYWWGNWVPTRMLNSWEADNVADVR